MGWVITAVTEIKGQDFVEQLLSYELKKKKNNPLFHHHKDLTCV